jgi:ubiquinone/menaquinone biosynthesis C-methylase UbiE
VKHVSYRDIFNVRADHYNDAMQLALNSRDAEFSQLLDRMKISPDDHLLDIPSGAGYLKSYLPNTVTVTSIDPSVGFSILSSSDIITDAVDQTGLASSSVDKVFSLAGLHHISDRTTFYNEMHRVLKPKGILGVSDVLNGTKVDAFLNEFVHRYNPLGHEGKFFDSDETKIIADSGFKVLSSETVSYTWKFNSKDQMLTFVKNLFGLDLADKESVEGGISDYLEFYLEDSIYYIPWELQTIIGQKL